MTDDRKKRHLSWDWVERHTMAFALDHKNAGLWTGIVPVARGGLVPATMLSHLMGIPIVGIIHAKSYGKDKVSGPLNIEFPRLGHELDPNRRFSDLLVVEDIIDSGKTIDAIADHSHFGNCSVLSMVVKERRPFKQQVMSCNLVREADWGTWVTFPWEVEL